MSKAFKSGELLGKGILDMTKVYSQQSAQEFLKGVVAALCAECGNKCAKDCSYKNNEEKKETSVEELPPAWLDWSYRF